MCLNVKDRGKLIYIKGDLFTTNANIIAHSVNCRGVFGAGVAKQMATLYPQARREYLNKHKNFGWQLGDVQFVEICPDRIIANMAIQENYGRQGMYVDYDAVYDCCNTLFNYAKECNMDIAIPKIGAGLGGGDWGKIESIICKLLRNYHVKVECYYYAL